ncbi:inosine monophosphate dehydrogenase [Massarina eburnea CBS 473.64]|uniref:Inosine monophosphate dehydrogenase n=1 Tax=Massarina eburnea CBS 473.64 TaxID=1395130 RepID=A0A6A6RNW4_9PLEO|nr:inosine monophosphate dehydrogenase [Massarina eburnea CBS 473.64]
MAPQPLKSYLPWSKSPLIINAPMAGFAGHRLATAVSLAGGLGFIGGEPTTDFRAEFTAASEILSSSSLQSHSTNTLPIGVGLLAFVLKIEDVVPLIGEFKPAIAWLFAAKQLDDYATWAKAIREASPETKVWVQVGSVAAAMHVAKTVAPDALCMQGADAGGHGFESGCSIISLLPEATDTLARGGFGEIPLVAAGGIVDGRGVAAALTLGAEGVVMGTRFLASEEVMVHPKYQAAVLEARDGGQVTKRSKLFDCLRGPNVWPEAYDGRSLLVQSYQDHASGVNLLEIQKLHKEAITGEDKGFATGLKGRASIWAGTGCGMVNQVESANNIVENVRKESVAILGKVSML